MGKQFVPWVLLNHPKLLGVLTMPHLTSSCLSRKENVSVGPVFSVLGPKTLENHILRDINCLCSGKWMAILVFLPSSPIILNPRNLLDSEAAPCGAAAIPAPTDPWFLGRPCWRRRHWQDGRQLAGSGQHLAQLGSSPESGSFPLWLGHLAFCSS